MQLMPSELKKEIETIAHGLNADGCTASPDFSWHVCCDEHDIVYRTGYNYKGEATRKARADLNLFLCMHRNANTWIGRNILSLFYYFMVSTFGWYAWFQKKQKFPKENK